jgi:nitrate reductase delta subunit
MRKTLKVLSALLTYPTAELQAAVPQMRAALDAEARLPPKNRDRIDRILE